MAAPHAYDRDMSLPRRTRSERGRAEKRTGPDLRTPEYRVDIVGQICESLGEARLVRPVDWQPLTNGFLMFSTLALPPAAAHLGAIAFGFGTHGPFGHGSSPSHPAEWTLAERFAQGDIDEKEHRARLEVLRATDLPAQPTDLPAQPTPYSRHNPGALCTRPTPLQKSDSAARG